MKIFKNLVALYLLLVYTPFTLQAQKALRGKKRVIVSQQVLSCYNPSNQSYYLFDDSTFYWRYSLRQKTWIKHPLVVQSELTWADLKEKYLVQAEDAEHVFMIEKGCGIVYQLSNDTLKRIDHSYAHKNQFGAAVFTYKNKVHFFGGYGYFRTKNLITYFEKGALEWFEVVNRNYNVRPDSRQAAQHQIIGNKLYVWGGYGRRGYKDEPVLDIWSFNFKTQLWNNEGALNPFYEELSSSINSLGLLPTTWFSSKEFLVHTDVIKNKIYYFQSPNFLTYREILPNFNETQFLVVKKGTNDTQCYATVLDQRQLSLGLNPQEQYFYKKVSLLKMVAADTYLWISLTINLILFILLFYIRRVHKTDWFKRRNAILHPEDFSDLEWQCLVLIEKHQSIELSALNDLFDEEELSYETLKKRRESFIKALRTKIALLTAVDVDQILYETKHPKDKRMKVINWGSHIEIEKHK